MARRGDQLREHILWTAKDVFLEFGYERTSMDMVAARAETSKRSLYAHFASKERLFLAVVKLVRDLFLSRLKSPGDYDEDSVEALTLFCGRYLEILLYEASIQMLRISMAEAARFPEQATEYFNAMFVAVQTRVSAYIATAFGVSASRGEEAAIRLLGQLLYPHFPRALFGLDVLAKSFDYDAIGADLDLRPVRQTVADLACSLRQTVF